MRINEECQYHLYLFLLIRNTYIREKTLDLSILHPKKVLETFCFLYILLLSLITSIISFSHLANSTLRLNKDTSGLSLDRPRQRIMPHISHDHSNKLVPVLEIAQDNVGSVGQDNTTGNFVFSAGFHMHEVMCLVIMTKKDPH